MGRFVATCRSKEELFVKDRFFFKDVVFEQFLILIIALYERKDPIRLTTIKYILKFNSHVEATTKDLKNKTNNEQ